MINFVNRLLSCLVLGILGMGAAKAQPLTLISPADQSQLIRVVPGGSTSFRFFLRNNSAIPSTRQPVELWGELGDEILSEYQFVSETPTVCADVTTVFGQAQSWVEQLAPNTVNECRFQIARYASSRHDYKLRIGASIGIGSNIPWEAEDGSFFNGSHYLGTLPNLIATATPLSPIQPGATSAEFRITVANQGPVEIGPPVFSSGCLPFFDGPDNVLHEVGNDSCEDLSGGACTGWYQYALRLPKPVPAGGSASCTIRMTFQPIQSSSGISLDLDEWQASPDGNWHFMVPPNLMHELHILAVPHHDAPAVIPSSSGRLSIFLALLLLAAAFLYARIDM